MTNPCGRKWLSTKEAADYLGCHSSFLERDRLNGTNGIPFGHLGSHVRYDVTDLDAYLESTKVKPLVKK